MNRRTLHIIGSVLGVSLAAVPQVTEALPEGKAKATVTLVGLALALVSNVWKAIGVGQPKAAP